MVSFFHVCFFNTKYWIFPFNNYLYIQKKLRWEFRKLIQWKATCQEQRQILFFIVIVSLTSWYKQIIKPNLLCLWLNDRLYYIKYTFNTLWMPAWRGGSTFCFTVWYEFALVSDQAVLLHVLRCLLHQMLCICSFGIVAWSHTCVGT